MSRTNASSLGIWSGERFNLLAPLPSLGTIVAILTLGLLLARGEWKLAGGIVLATLILFSSLAAPHYLGLFAMLAFLGTAVPMVNQGGALNQYRWVMLVTMALGLLLRNSMQSTSARWHPVHFSLALFVVCAAISSSYSVNGLMTLLKAGTFGCLIFGALLYGRLETRSESDSSCKLLDQLYWCALLGGVGCVLALAGLLPTGAGYFKGPFANSNALGAFIPFIAPVLLLKLSQSVHRAPLIRVLNICLAAGYAVVLIMSRSRGGMVATFVGCAWWLYFSYRRVFGRFVVGVVLASVILLAYFPKYIDSLNRIYVQKGTHYVLQSRGRLMEESWNAAMESPIIGVGFGVSKGYSEDWDFGFESAGMGREKMNSLLAAVEEVGIIGAALLLFPIVWIFIAASRRLLLIRKFHPSAEEFWTILTLSACLLGGLANSLSEAWLTAAGFYSAIMFWLIFGVLTARLTIPFRAPE